MAAEPLAQLPGTVEGELTAFRWADYDVPFWARENTTSGRWNFALEGSTQYWALTPEASWAELIRAEQLLTEADLDLVRKPFWVTRVPTGGLVDLTRADARERYGISEADLIADDRQACQALAVELRKHHRGVIAPSAAMPEHRNVTLFGPRRAIDWTSRSPLASTVPTTRAAIGRPPDGLIERVPFRAAPPSGDRLF